LYLKYIPNMLYSSVLILVLYNCDSETLLMIINEFTRNISISVYLFVIVGMFLLVYIPLKQQSNFCHEASA